MYVYDVYILTKVLVFFFKKKFYWVTYVYFKT